MCGRLNVIDNPVMLAVLNCLGIDFVTVSNADLRPTQQVATVALVNGHVQQANLSWGIKPSWSKRLLINAQGETVADKRTFKKAFKSNRCVVPVSGWYEWLDLAGQRKQKHLFEHVESETLFIAGIWYAEEESNKLVTLTTTPNKTYAAYHHRMPLLIDSSQLLRWLDGGVDAAQPLIRTPSEITVKMRY